MGELFARVLDNLRELWPCKIIRSYQRGIRFKNGVVHEEQLVPGLYWFIPFFWAIEEVSVVEDVLDLPTQSITTADGKMVSFSANVSFEVTDAVLLYTQVQDFEQNLSRIACGHLAMRVREWRWDELQESQKKLEASLRDTLTTRVKGWGCRIIECRLTDLVQARQIRLVP
jgi:regulator of protease activity HflC (stomatin/prohibitin superfamily)